VDTGAVRTQIETALRTITGLRVAEWGHQINPPAALVTLPDSVKFHQTYGAGTTRIDDMMVLVIVGKPESRTSVKELMPYVAETGAKSIKAVLEGYTWTALEVMTVLSADFDVVTFKDQPYLAAMFHLDIFGRGAV
jgi:hypothetical protein